MIFANAASGAALATFPEPRHLCDTFAVSFVVQPDSSEMPTQAGQEPEDGLREEGLSVEQRQRTRAARQAVSKIAKLKVNWVECGCQVKVLKKILYLEIRKLMYL